MKKYRNLIVVVLISLNQILFAINGREIVQKANKVKSPLSAHEVVKMEKIDRDGDIDSWIIEEWSQNENDLDSTVMVFRKPASVANTRFLQKENNSRDDDKWIYLPALKRVRRIASSERGKAFMGTDFSYEDMNSKEVDQDTHIYLGEELFNSWDCYKVKSSDKEPDNTEYSFRNVWYDKITYIPVKIEMYDKKEKLVKIMTVKKMEQISGYWTATDFMIKNVQSKHSTHVSIIKVAYDEDVSSNIFTTNYLEEGR